MKFTKDGYIKETDEEREARINRTIELAKKLGNRVNEQERQKILAHYTKG